MLIIIYDVMHLFTKEATERQCPREIHIIRNSGGERKSEASIKVGYNARDPGDYM